MFSSSVVIHIDMVGSLLPIVLARCDSQQSHLAKQASCKASVPAETTSTTKPRCCDCYVQKCHAAYPTYRSNHVAGTAGVNGGDYQIMSAV